MVFSLALRCALVLLAQGCDVVAQQKTREGRAFHSELSDDCVMRQMRIIGTMSPKPPQDLTELIDFLTNATPQRDAIPLCTSYQNEAHNLFGR